jgi:hypothetical protein
MILLILVLALAIAGVVLGLLPPTRCYAAACASAAVGILALARLL